MKTKFNIFILSIVTLFVISCDNSGDELPVVNKNPMVNTIWASSASGDHAFWIEFTSNTNFLEYYGDLYGNTNTTGVDYGTYRYSNGRIDFITHDAGNFNYAIVNGSVLSLYYKNGYCRTFKKKQ
jgi:hypothetical protein